MRIRYLLALLPATALALTALPSTPTAAAPPPETLITVPAVQEWQPSRAKAFAWKGRDIVVPRGDAELTEVARTFAADLGALSGRPPSVVEGKARPGSISLARGEFSQGSEAYRLDIGKTLTITGASDHGVFNGTRTVLQLLADDASIPAGTVTDWPDKEVRSVLVDNTPRHFSLGWWENLFKRMSYVKLNDTNLYLDGVGLDRSEMRTIAELGEKYFVKVVPQINMPSHMHVLLPSKPEFQLLNQDGTRNPTALDLTNPDAVEWALGLIDEHIELFPGDEWHLGSDEFPGWPGTGENHPQLDAYAKERFGPEATFSDLFADFQNQANALVKSHGKTMRVWNDMIRHSEVVQLDPDVTVEYWIQHDALPGLLSAAEVAERGNPLINAYIDHLYYDQSRRNLDPRDIYEKLDVNRLPWETDVPPDSVRGARMAVWLAWIYTPMESDAEVLDNITAPMAALGQKAWGSPRLVDTWTEFQAQVLPEIGSAPGQHPSSLNSIEPNPATARNADASVSYFARDADGTLWTGKQSAPGLTHFSKVELADGIAGDPVVVTLDDGRLQVAARTARGAVLVATQAEPNTDRFDTQVIAARTDADPALLPGRLVVNDNGKLTVVDLGSGRRSAVLTQAVGRPDAALVDGSVHVTVQTRKGIAHAAADDGGWAVTTDATRLASAPEVLDVGGSPVLVGITTDGALVAGEVSGSGVTWDEIVADAVGQQASAVGTDGVAHVVVRTAAATVRHATLRDGQWKHGEVGHHTTTDDPSFTLNADNEPFIFFKYDNGMQVVAVPDGGGYATNVIAESTVGRAAATTDAEDRPIYFVATSYGDLQTGTKWGNLWQWGRDFAIGAMQYPDDALTPDWFGASLLDDPFDEDSGRYTTVQTNPGELAPEPVIGAGTLAVSADAPFYSTVVSDVPVASGDTVVITSVDEWLDGAQGQNTVMLGFVRDAANYSVMWVAHNGHRIGFDTVSDGRLTPDGAFGNVPVVVEEGDRIAVVLTGKWMVGYVERAGTWHRVHTGVAFGADDLADPEVRAQYRYAVALRGDSGTLKVGELRAAER